MLPITCGRRRWGSRVALETTATSIIGTNEATLFSLLETFTVYMQSNLSLCCFPSVFLPFVKMCLDSGLCGFHLLVSGVPQLSMWHIPYPVSAESCRARCHH